MPLPSNRLSFRAMVFCTRQIKYLPQIVYMKSYQVPLIQRVLFFLQHIRWEHHFHCRSFHARGLRFSAVFCCWHKMLGSRWCCRWKKNLWFARRMESKTRSWSIVRIKGLYLQTNYRTVVVYTWCRWTWRSAGGDGVLNLLYVQRVTPRTCFQVYFSVFDCTLHVLDYVSSA